MNVDKLIHMANRIGDFYQSYPDNTEALEGIANHIAKFWEPRMRSAIMLELDSARAGSFMPLVMASLQLNRERLTPKAG